MDEINIKELWQSSNKKLELSLSLSRKNAEDVTKLKMQSLLSSMKPLKLFTILVGLVWVGLGSVVIVNLFVYAYSKISLFFLFSAAIQVLLTAIALIIYIYQLILIHEVDISEPILETQEKLASLKSSTLWVTRVLFLQLPVWTTFYWNESMFENGNAFLYVIQAIITLSFTYLAIWLFFNIKFENKDKKWFKVIFNGIEWIPLLKAIELNKEIEEFKQELTKD